MIDVTTLLVVALILLQLYICACTYWVFKKIDRYENVAFAIIDKYLSVRSRRGDVNISNTVAESSTISKECVNTHLISLVDQNSPALIARERIIYLVNRVNSFAPERVQIVVHTLMTKWYSQLGLDLLSLGLCVRSNSAVSLYEEKAIEDVKAE